MVDEQTVSKQYTSTEAIRSRIDELIAQMTPAEKASQLTQYFYFTLPPGAEADPALGIDRSKQPAMVEEALGRGGAGSLLFVTDPAQINRLQRLVIDGGRFGIPALFGFDVIHGLRTILPVPIAMAASWDPTSGIPAPKAAPRSRTCYSATSRRAESCRSAGRERSGRCR